jgi:release factor glutamine methyltransferase
MQMQKTDSANSSPRASGAAHGGDSTVRALVKELTSTLELGGNAEPRNTARDIVAALAGVARYWTVTNPDVVLDRKLRHAARLSAQRLIAGAPFAYAVGSAQFRKLTLQIDERVLIPRPETEILVEEILARFGATNSRRSDWGTAVDIGTGSGAIALALAAEGGFARVVATDTSLDALDVARRNATIAAKIIRCPVEFRAGSLLSPVRDIAARLLVSNPPYVSYDEALHLPASVRNWEPPTALLSGSNGLALTAAIVQEGTSLLEPGGILALEVDERRASLVAELAMAHGGYTDIGVVLDLTGRERFVFAARA